MQGKKYYYWTRNRKRHLADKHGGLSADSFLLILRNRDVLALKTRKNWPGGTGCTPPDTTGKKMKTNGEKNIRICSRQEERMAAKAWRQVFPYCRLGRAGSCSPQWIRKLCPPVPHYLGYRSWTRCAFCPKGQESYCNRSSRL